MYWTRLRPCWELPGGKWLRDETGSKGYEGLRLKNAEIIGVAVEGRRMHRR